MRVKLVGLNEEMLEAVKGLEELIDFQLYNEKGSNNENLEIINVSKLPEESENVIEVLREKNNEIRYKKKHHFFRAFSLYLQFLKKGEESFRKSEKTYIDSVGAMIDASRNAVYRVSEVKKILGYMALMGHNRCMLYTEDTYEIDGYPYFGYMRGRYSKEELREIDDYGYSLGIEVVPCIQTLAHLKQTLRWPYGEGMKDTQDVLLVGEEKTYKFIEVMISSLRKCFRSKNIHIGMDEAFDLGRGHYLTKHGHVSHQKLMVEHLNKVNEIAKKYDFKPMIWDDMFLRCGAPDGGYYDLDIVITPEIANNIPEEVSLVYWDYYNSDEEKYKKLLDIRDNFNNNIIFAGGCWRWSGFAPNYSKTFETTNAALNQCKAKGIKEVFATAWGDDGSETPIYSIIVGLILFGEHGYYNKVDKEWIDERCKSLTGLSMEDFTSLEELDLVPSVKTPNMEVCNPSKYIAYQDLLLGAFDKHLEGLDLEEHYINLSKKYEEIGERSERFKLMFTMYSKLAVYLSVKSEIGLEIRKAYLEKDKDALRLIAYNFIPEIQEKLKSFHKSFRDLWYKECKGQGFEVIDIRLGGVMARCDSAMYRIKAYLKGNIDKIEELEEERLYFSEHFGGDDCKLICCNEYEKIATQNILSW
ncbi:MAG: beta-N-acetylhexosaminidase [Clostridium perfringens]